MAEEPQEVTAEQLVEAIRQMKVSDLLASTIATVGQLGYAKLDPDARDLDQVRLAIEALKALVPVLEDAVEEQSIRDYNQLIANLQLAYASAASEKPAEAASADKEASAEEEPTKGSPAGR